MLVSFAFQVLSLLFQFVALPTIFAMALCFCLNRDLFWYVAKMSLFYASILASSFFTCFGAVATYFRNEGCMFAMCSFHLISSYWLDITVEIRGAEKIEQASGPDQNPVVIISNHQSSLDLFTMSKMWPAKCTAMMKHSLKYVPFFNIGAILSNSIFVDRSSKENAKEALNESVRKMVEKKLKIWMFPEGTRHHSHGLLPFKKGAFNIAVGGHFPIVPVVISDYTPFYSKPLHYFRPRGHVVVQVMDPVPTEQLTNEDVLELCERVQKSMAEVYETVSKDADQVVQERSTRIGGGS